LDGEKFSRRKMPRENGRKAEGRRDSTLWKPATTGAQSGIIAGLAVPAAE